MFIMKYFKSLLYIFITLLTLVFFIGTLNYFNVLTNNITKIMELITIILSMFIGGFYLGKKSIKKGYLEGLKIGLFMIVLLFFLNVFGFNNQASFSYLIFYIIILVSSILGSIIGINKKSS